MEARFPPIGDVPDRAATGSAGLDLGWILGAFLTGRSRHFAAIRDWSHELAVCTTLSSKAERDGCAKIIHSSDDQPIFVLPSILRAQRNVHDVIFDGLLSPSHSECLR